MEVQPSYLFQLEDGGSLSIAVHSDVPQYERFCEMIHANRGFVVEDASSADFCIVSLAAPGADGIAEELRAEGRLAIQDYWIRDSIDAEKLLPWYPYQIGPPPCLVAGSGRVHLLGSTTETEERDIHELVIMSARYWPLFAVDELHRYVSRKCPHRSATSFKYLYKTHQVDIDARVSYLRGKLDNVMSFNNDFSRKPRMSFGSPSKHVPLAIQAPPSSTAFATSSAAALMPTPTATSGSRGDQTETIDFRGGQSSAVFHHEIPYEPPNIDNSPTRSISPPPVNTSAQQTATTSVAQLKEGTRINVPGAEAAPSPQPELPVPASAPAPAKAPRLGAAGFPMTAQDKHELAKFLFEYPKDAKVRFEIYIERFRKTYSRGNIRSAGAWKYLYRKYDDEIRRIMNRMQKEAAARPSRVTGKKTKDVQMHAASSATPPTSGVDRVSRNSNRLAPYRPKPTIKMITDEDKQALALWTLDHPKDPKMNLKRYYELFARHYDVNNERTPAGWESGANRHRDDLAERRRKIVLEREGKGKASDRHVISRSVPKDSLKIVRPVKKSGGNLDDVVSGHAP